MNRIELGGVDVDEQQPGGDVDTYRWQWRDPRRSGVELALVFVPAAPRWYRTARIDGGGWAPEQPAAIFHADTDLDTLRACAELVVMNSTKGSQ